jgi:hypothetical protein
LLQHTGTWGLFKGMQSCTAAHPGSWWNWVHTCCCCQLLTVALGVVHHEEGFVHGTTPIGSPVLRLPIAAGKLQPGPALAAVELHAAQGMLLCGLTDPCAEDSDLKGQRLYAVKQAGRCTMYTREAVAPEDPAQAEQRHRPPCPGACHVLLLHACLPTPSLVPASAWLI